MSVLDQNGRHGAQRYLMRNRRAILLSDAWGAPACPNSGLRDRWALVGPERVGRSSPRGAPGAVDPPRELEWPLDRSRVVARPCSGPRVWQRADRGRAVSRVGKSTALVLRGGPARLGFG